MGQFFSYEDAVETARDIWFNKVDVNAWLEAFSAHPQIGLSPSQKPYQCSPFIEELNYPMPEDCAGGNTRVLVNGRELHQRDLKLLGKRGLPTDRDRSYIIEMLGRVLDEVSGASLNATSLFQASGTTLIPIASSQSVVIGIVPVFDFYSGLPRKTSPFLQQTIATFEKYIGSSSMQYVGRGFRSCSTTCT